MCWYLGLFTDGSISYALTIDELQLLYSITPFIFNIIWPIKKKSLVVKIFSYKTLLKLLKIPVATNINFTILKQCNSS